MYLQIQMSVPVIPAISGARTEMEDTPAIATKATNFKDRLRVLVSYRAYIDRHLQIKRLAMKHAL